MSAHKPREYAVINKNEGGWMNRLLIGTPMTGLVRAEWCFARYGQIVPTNWSLADAWQYIHSYAPMKYLVADAQNLICKVLIEQDFEWLFSLEHDNVLPRDAFIRLNEYMRQCKVPVMSGLYFTRSVPPEPLIYRGRGSSFYTDWKVGDKVWCDGIGMGCTLIHGSIIKALWERSPEVVINGIKTRKVFSCPQNTYTDPETQAAINVECGTSDLEFCSRLIREKIFEAAGWPEYQKKKFPFLVDTAFQVGHIEQDGRMFPLGGIPPQYLPKPPKPKKVNHGSHTRLAGSAARTAADAADSGKSQRAKSPRGKASRKQSV